MTCPVAVPVDPLMKTNAYLKQSLYFRLQVHSTLWVKVTHVNNPNDFYARPSCFGSDYINAIRKRSSRTDFTVANNELVIYKRVNKWIRGKIIFVDQASNCCQVFALDYGHIDTISLNDTFYPLGENSSEIPRLVIHCTTLDCFPVAGNWDESSTEAFRQIVQQQTCFIKNKGNYGPSIYAIKFQAPDVSGSLLTCELSMLSISPCVINTKKCRSTKRHYDYRSLEVGDKIHVKFMCLDEMIKERFYVAQIDDYKKHQEGIERFTKESKSFERLDVDEVTMGKPVCYRYDDIAYRARFLDTATKNGKVKLQLMDTGRILNGRLDSLFHLKAQYLQDDAVSIYCKLKQVRTTFIWFRPEAEFYITVHKVGDKITEPHMVVISEN